jgi:activating signal cointegrator complex subunit 2
MTITASLPPYPSRNAQTTLQRSQLTNLNQKIVLGLAQVLDLPSQKRDDQSCREFVASYAQDTAFLTLEALIWGSTHELDQGKWTKDERLIRQRTLLLAERLAVTKPSNSPSLDLQTLLDLSIVFYQAHPSRIRSLFSTALTATPSLKIAVEMETVPAFTELFSPSVGEINTGLYGLRKAAQCLKSFVIASPPAFTRLFALNKEFVTALADVYHHGLSSIATTYGFTGSEDEPNTQDQKIFVETKVALMDAFHAIVKYGMVDAILSGDASTIQEVLEVLFTLIDRPAAQLSSHPMDAEPIPFLNRSLLEDYHDAYDFAKTLTSALRQQEREDARLDVFEAHLNSIRAAGGNERRPGALKILLYSSGAPLPRIDRKGKGRADPNRVDTPPPVDPSDNLDMKVTQVLDILPDTPLEYVRALLQHPDYPFKGNPERVVEALLEGTAPPPENLARISVELPRLQKPSQEQYVYTQERKNIFDDQEMDLTHIRIGKKR